VVSELSVVVGRSVSWCMTRSGTGTATPVTTVATIADRGLRQLARTPQVLGISVIQSVLFLLMFRYVIGGAIDVRGVSYVNFLVPGFVVSGLTFTAGGSAVAVAEDAASGLYDRLRSLPIADVAVLAGRALGDATRMIFVSLVTLLVGLAVGFRFGASAADAVAALGLVTVYAVALAWVFVWLGLVSGSAQAAQGLGIIGCRSHSSPAHRTDPLNARRAAALRRAPATHVHGQRRPRTRDRRRRHSRFRPQHLLLHHRFAAVVTRARAIFAPLAVRAYRRR